MLHRYELPALDVNLTFPPEQNVVGPLAVMVGIAGNAITVVVIPFEIACDPIKQGLALEVITTVTTSLFDNVALVY